jgi:hypothetical protein
MNITNVSHSLFTQFGLNVSITSPTINQSLTFSQTMIGYENSSPLLNQTLIFNQNLSIDAIFITHLNQNLTFNSNVDGINHSIILNLPLNTATFDQILGFNQTVIVSFGIVYEVIEIANIEFVTTSGKLGVKELNDLVNIIITNYNKRSVDWVIAWLGTVVAIIHTNNTVTYI